ncbi:MAG: hypothetical protein H6712_09685 [Myxococcales bacterium]|nr:hypothetical protein [Myxococcales bacterium]MCB9714115.1 hypothetical protein [Myxococcales bacterium]
MPRLIPRASAAALHWLALSLAGLVLLLGPLTAHAAPPSDCLAAGAIAELEPGERTLLRQMCEGSPSPEGAERVAEARATLIAGLRLEGWKAAFVARAIASTAPAPAEATARQRAQEAWLGELLARTHTQRGKEAAACTTFHDLASGAIRELEHGVTGTIPVSPRDLEADDACVSDDEQERLDALIEGWHLLTIPGRSRDVVDAWSVDVDGLEVLRVEPIPYLHDGQRGWLLLLPRDRMVTLTMRQPDLDMPWAETRRLVDIDSVLSRRRSECVIIEAGADPEGGWSVVVNGSSAPLETVSTAAGGQRTQRAILNLPRDPATDERAAPRELVFVSTQPGIEPWVSSLAEPREEGHGRCRSVAYDLSGLNNPQEHIGIAQVAVDDSCRNRGIVPSRVRSYAEGYTERADKKLIPLDAWAEVMEIFRDLESRLGSRAEAERGASRGDLDDSEQMVVLASELRRRGVDSLLYFDVRCPERSTEVTVIGTRVDLDDFVGRAKSKVTGVDTDDLLAVRSHDSRSRDLREAMEVVLSDLLDQPHVRFVDPPDTIERGLRRDLRVVGIGAGVDVEVWSLGAARTEAVCTQVEELNDLSSFAKLRTIRDAARHGSSVPRLRERTTGNHTELELGGLPKGKYLAIATAVTNGESTLREDDEIGHALCFEVVEREIELVTDILGFKQWTTPRTNPISSQLSFVRISGSVRYTTWEFFEFGGSVGYEHVEYTTQSAPVWDELSLVDLTESLHSQLSWRRNGIFMGPFAGLRFPFARWPWPVCRKGKGDDCAIIRERRQANPSLATFFVNAQLLFNVGIANIDGLPAELAAVQSDSVLAGDVDLSFKSGIRIRPRRLASFGVFGGLLLSDLANSTIKNALDEEFWANDWGVRAFVGIELGLGLLGRSS